MNRLRSIWLGCLLGILVISAPVVAADTRQNVALAQQTCPMQKPPEAVTPPTDGTQLLKRYMYLLATCVECPDNLHARVRALSTATSGKP